MSGKQWRKGGLTHVLPSEAWEPTEEDLPLVPLTVEAGEVLSDAVLAEADESTVRRLERMGVL